MKRNRPEQESHLLKNVARKRKSRTHIAGVPLKTAVLSLTGLVILAGFLFVVTNQKHSMTESSIQASSMPSSSTSPSSSEAVQTPSATPVLTATLTPANTPSVTPTKAAQSIASTGTVPNTRYGWSYTPPSAAGALAKASNINASLCEKYDGIWQADSTKKKVYITMDVGYEYNNNTTKILDIAKAKNFKINFFITNALFKTDALKALILRMKNEGHLVGNHTWNHPHMTNLFGTGGADAVNDEMRKIETAYRELTGSEISRYMRPPYGEFSEATMQLMKNNGYKTVFWSFAYEDWLTDKQKPVDEAKQIVLKNLHNGVVYLLHTVSNTNVQILPDLVDEIRAQGYEIGLVSDIK